MSTSPNQQSLEGLCQLASMIEPNKDQTHPATRGAEMAQNVLRSGTTSAQSQPPSLESSSPPSPTSAGVNAANFQNIMMGNPYGMMGFPFGAVPQQPGANVNGQAAAQASLQSTLFAQQMHYAAMMGYSAALQNPQIAQQHLAMQKAATLGTNETANPTGKKTGKWKEDEILTLRQGIDEYGRDWVKIAKMIPSRTREQVKNKGYAMILEDKTPNKATGHWKNVELEALKKGMEDWGPDWHRIAQVIPTRSWSQIVRKGKHMIDGSEVVLNSAAPMLPPDPGACKDAGDPDAPFGQVPGYAHLTPQPMNAVNNPHNDPPNVKIRKNGHMANPTLDMPGGRLADSHRKHSEHKNKGGRPRKSNQERAREAAEKEAKTIAKLAQQATHAVMPLVNPMALAGGVRGLPSTLSPDVGTAAIMQAAALGPMGTGTGIPQPLLSQMQPAMANPLQAVSMQAGSQLSALQQLQMHLPGRLPIAGLPQLPGGAGAVPAVNPSPTEEPAAKRLKVEQPKDDQEEATNAVGIPTPSDVRLPAATRV